MGIEVHGENNLLAGRPPPAKCCIQIGEKLVMWVGSHFLDTVVVSMVLLVKGIDMDACLVDQKVVRHQEKGGSVKATES